MKRILIIDDDPYLRKTLTQFFMKHSFEVSHLPHSCALEKEYLKSCNMVLLELTFPTMHCFDKLREIRSEFSMPVVMLTEGCGLEDHISALELGADDYIMKPVEPKELFARMRAILRRTGTTSLLTPTVASSPDTIRLGKILMDVGGQEVLYAGRKLELTYIEFRIVELFLRNVGKIVTREEIARTVLGRSPYPFDRSIDVHVANLRRKFDGKATPKDSVIKTVRGSGYVYTIRSEHQSDVKVNQLLSKTSGEGAEIRHS